MTDAISYKWSSQTATTKRFPGHEEWNWKQRLLRQSMEEVFSASDKPDIYQSDIITASGNKFTGPNNCWKIPFYLPSDFTITLETENSTELTKSEPQKQENFISDVARESFVPVVKAEEENILDWDAYIDTPPPPRRSGTIKVRFKYMGRSKPIPIDDPWA